jgi:ABC-type multidrug transport system fused ATPase/permease subunit
MSGSRRAGRLVPNVSSYLPAFGSIVLAVSPLAYRRRPGHPNWSITKRARPRGAAIGALPKNIFRYVLMMGGVHQPLLVGLSISVFLLEIVPLELQRRIVNDLVTDRPFRRVITLCLVYAGAVLGQGGTKLVLNVYRSWVGERAIRDLRRRIHAVIGTPATSRLAVEAQGIAVSMIVAEVEPIGGFIGASISEPLLQGGILTSVLAYLVHLDPWIALGAFALFVPQLLFVPLMQTAVNRRAGSRIRMLRRLGVGVIDRAKGHFCDDDRRIDRAFALDMGIFRLKFTMNFLMNLCGHLQIISAPLIGGWWVYTGRLQTGVVVAFISGIGRLNDPWGDLVNYFRDLTVNQVKYRLLTNAVNRLAEGAEP